VTRPCQSREEVPHEGIVAMRFQEVRENVIDAHQSVVAARKAIAVELRLLLSGTGSRNVSVDEELVGWIEDLGPQDRSSHGLTNAEYAYSILLANAPALFEDRYIGIDPDNKEGITFIVQQPTAK